MKDLLVLPVEVQNLLCGEEGQDVIEYAMLIAVIALGTIATMKTVAGDIIAAFDYFGSSVASSV